MCWPLWRHFLWKEFVWTHRGRCGLSCTGLEGETRHKETSLPLVVLECGKTGAFISLKIMLVLAPFPVFSLSGLVVQVGLDRTQSGGTFIGTNIPPPQRYAGNQIKLSRGALWELPLLTVFIGIVWPGQKKDRSNKYSLIRSQLYSLEISGSTCQ